VHQDHDGKAVEKQDGHDDAATGKDANAYHPPRKCEKA
jgi:hypothetical protein